MDRLNVSARRWLDEGRIKPPYRVFVSVVEARGDVVRVVRLGVAMDELDVPTVLGSGVRVLSGQQPDAKHAQYGEARWQTPDEMR